MWFTHFICRKNDLRTLSGKFLRVESCHPERSDFLGLCTMVTMTIMNHHNHHDHHDHHDYWPGRPWWLWQLWGSWRSYEEVGGCTQGSWRLSVSVQSPCCGKLRGPRGAYFPIHPTSRQFIDILFSRGGGIGNCTPNGWVQWVVLTVLDSIHSRSRKKMLILTVTLSRLCAFWVCLLFW